MLPEATDIQNEIAELVRAPGELSFEARIGPTPRRIWFRIETATEEPIVPAAEATLSACLLPAMAVGGSLRLEHPVSPRLLRSQREFQAIQRAWSLDWRFVERPLREVEVLAPARAVEPAAPSGRIAALFSGGVDSWSTVLSQPELTDLIFIDGFDIWPGEPNREKLLGKVEPRVRAAAEELGLPLHVVRTNLRELTDPLVPWLACYGSSTAAVATLFEGAFDRILISGDSDFEIQEKVGANWLVDQLLGTESLEIVETGGGLSRVERTRMVAEHPVARRSLRVCWENRDTAYNCGRCRKCLLTMTTLEALGLRAEVESFPPELDFACFDDVELTEPINRHLWEDVLDTARAAGRPDLERAVEGPVLRARRAHGLPPGYRRRGGPGPAPSVRIAVIVPCYRSAPYLAGAASSALAQEAPFGVGVVIVDDGCPEPETERIGLALRDAHPDRIEFVQQENRGVAAARNVGIRQAIRRWPGVEAFFFLDADNLLSPQTMAEAWRLLEEDPELSWSSPALEQFGASRGVWNVLGPHLPYRQLFANQSDTGTLVRRRVFEAGIEFDETMRRGFEDWEFFLRSSLAGFRGGGAGPCGFRYRRLPDSMVVGAMRQEAELKADIRARSESAYRAGALCRREHAEMPRFALVRCDRADALLLAAADLEPRRVPLLALCGEEQPAAVILLTTAAAVEELRERRLLAGVLLRLQLELHCHPAVALGDGSHCIAIATRPAALSWLRLPSGELWIERSIEMADGAEAVPQPVVGEQLAEVLDALCAVPERPTHVCGAALHPRFFEELHLDSLQTTVPWAGHEGGRTLLTVAARAGGEGWDATLGRVAATRAEEPGLTAHLILTEMPMSADHPVAEFDTTTCLGGGDLTSAEQLVEQLEASADLVEEPAAAGTELAAGITR